MIGRLFANGGANAALTVVLSGTVAALVARGAGRGFPGRSLAGILSNPVPRAVRGGSHAGLRSPAAGPVSERGAAA